MALRVVKLRLESGRCPFDDWYWSLKDNQTSARATRGIRKLRSGSGDTKRIREIYELRLDFGPGYRVYFGRIGAVAVVLIAGGDKGKQQADIERAEALWSRFKAIGSPTEALIPWEEEDDNDNH